MKDGQVVFDAIASISAGQQVVLKVKGKADSAGSHRIRTDIVCPSADTHLVNEQTSYFFQNQRSKNTVATSQETVAAMPGAMLPGATLETAPTALHITAQPAELPKQDAVLDNNALQTATTLDPFSVQ